MNDSPANLPPWRLLPARLGVRPRSGMARMFMGSRSQDLLHHLACDILLVREEGGADG